MRVILSRMLLGASILSLTACVILGVNVIRSYQEAVAKDDFAGFSLGMHFLLYVLAPLTLPLFLGTCLFDPPAWMLKRLGIGTSASQPSSSFLRRAIVGSCLAGAAAILLRVAYFGRESGGGSSSLSLRLPRPGADLAAEPGLQLSSVDAGCTAPLGSAEVGDLMFSIRLEDVVTADYGAIDIPEAVQSEVDQIVGSFERW